MTINLKDKEINKEMEERQKDVIHIEKALPRLSFELMQSKIYFPISFLMDSIMNYEFIFDIGSIFYASLSFDLALWIKIYDEIILRNIAIVDIKKLKSRELINKAYEFNIIDEGHRDIAHNIRKLRNGYSHFNNAIYSWLIAESNTAQIFAEVAANDPSLIKEMKKIESDALRYDKSQEEIRQIFGSIIYQETIDFMTERKNQYFTWLKEEFNKNPKKYKEHIKHFGDIKYKGRRYDQKRFDSLDMIKWNFDILKYLKFI